MDRRPVRLTDEELYLDYCKEMEQEPVPKSIRQAVVAMVTAIRKLEPRINSGVHLCDSMILADQETGKMPDDYFQ